MITEHELRERFPEIPWDQPIGVSIPTPALVSEGNVLVVEAGSLSFWVCRYCIAIKGMKGGELREGRVSFAFPVRAEALDHIEREHHE